MADKEHPAEGVGSDMFVDFSKAGGFPSTSSGQRFDGFLEGRFVDVVALDDSRFGVWRTVEGGEDVLPGPLPVGVGVFLF